MRSGQVPLSIKLAYGLGKAAEGVKTRAFEFFLFFYFVQVLGLSGTWTGIAVAIALACDAVTDPLAGSLSDRCDSRLGRRHPFMFAAVVPLGVSFYLVFVPPAGLSQFGLALWLCFFAVAVRSSLTLFHVPYLSLGAELSSDYDERTSIAMSRMVFGIVGSVFGLLIGMNYYFRSTPEFPNGQLDPGAYEGFALTCSIAMMLMILCSAWWTRSEIPRLPKASADQAPFEFGQVYRDMAEALRNPSFRALFIGLLFLAVTIGVGATLNMHVATYYWQLSSSQISLFVLAGGAGFGSSLILVRRLQMWLDKREAFLMALGGAAFFASLAPVLREMGLFPANGTAALLPSILGIFSVASFFAAVAAVTGASMMADVADDHEYRTGLRQEGVFFGAASFSGKLSSAIGHVIAGIALDLIRFPKDVLPGQVEPGVLTRLGLLTGPGVALFAVLGMYFFSGYLITRESHGRTQRALLERGAHPSSVTPHSDAA
jgi:GPH family glycoside/pentoside/hexuronide:cation symporter